MAEREQPVSAPRPLSLTLDSAVRLALHNGTIPEEMIRERWATTYQSTVEAVEAAITRAQTRMDPNSIEGEGK
jgi:hypothetical protein